MSKAALLEDDLTSEANIPLTKQEENWFYQAEKWKWACKKERSIIKMLKMFELVDTPIRRNQIDTKWVFIGKKDEAENVTKLKAR